MAKNSSILAKFVKNVSLGTVLFATFLVDYQILAYFKIKMSLKESYLKRHQKRQPKAKTKRNMHNIY